LRQESCLRFIFRKNTAFFLGLEKTRQTKKTINELYDKNGKSTTNQNEIIEIEVYYNKKLYKSTNPDNDKLITGVCSLNLC
jgi:hypothetical protein